MTAPWIMWGSDQSYTLTDPGGGGGQQQGAQLARIDYARPESWNFFFFLSMQSADVAIGAATIWVDFELQIGLGRSALVLPKFCHLELNTAIVPSIPAYVYATQVIGPYRNAAEQAALQPNITTEFTAQSINCTYRMEINSPAGPGTCTGVVACWFSPKVHVRPEWFADGNFTGGENQGT